MAVKMPRVGRIAPGTQSDFEALFEYWLKSQPYRCSLADSPESFVLILRSVLILMVLRGLKALFGATEGMAGGT